MEAESPQQQQRPDRRDEPAATAQPAPSNIHQSAPPPPPPPASQGAARPRVRIHISANGSSTPPQNSARGHRTRGNVDPLQSQTHQLLVGGNSTQPLRFVPVPQWMPAPPLPPLEPLPLPHPRGRAADESDEAKKFECAICFEYLSTPVGCGSCSARFCRSCLERAAAQDLRRSAAAARSGVRDPPSARCPHCRAPLAPASVRFDSSLQGELDSCPTTVRCPFDGCGASPTVGELRNHETTCPFLPLRCRHHQWGCGWTGLLSQLPRHEQECEINKLKSVIERTRQSHWEMSHAIQQCHGWIALSHGRGVQNLQMVMQLRRDNGGNFWDVLCFGWEAALFPERFGRSKERWGSMVSSEKGRGLVCNVLVVWPWLGVVFRAAVAGMQDFSRLAHAALEGSSEENAFRELVDTAVLSLAVGVMGVLLVACFYVDVKSPLEWSLYNIWSVVGPQPLVRDVAALCMTVTIFVWMELFGPVRGFMVWCLATIVSLGGSSFVAGMIEKVTDAINILESARSLPVAVTGLRYGCLMSICNFLPSIGAVLMFRILPVIMETKMPMIFGAEHTECFLSQCSCSHAMIGMVAFFAMTSSTATNEHSLKPFVELASSMFVLGIINTQVYLLERAGSKLAALNFAREGDSNNTTGMVGLDSGEVLLPTQRPSYIGLSVVAIFVFASVLIATV